MKREIKIGHTNKEKYVEDGKIVIKKTNNGFNHKIDYKVLEIFDFVPKLISETDEEVVWEFIEGKMLEKPTDQDLAQVAKILRTLHKADVNFPKNNFKERYTQYIKEGHELGRRWPEIENNWKEMQALNAKMKKINATHNDVWWQNLIKDKNGKIWLVDWEYATMGDKHFDLAFYMRSSRLDKRQEKIFLDAYDSVDDYKTYFEEFLPKWERFANWLTLTWAYGQREEPFPLDWIKKFMNDSKK